MEGRRVEEAGLIERFSRLVPFPTEIIRIIEAAAGGASALDELPDLLVRASVSAPPLDLVAEAVSHQPPPGATPLDEELRHQGRASASAAAMVEVCRRRLVDDAPLREIVRVLWDHSLAVSALARELAPRFDARSEVAGALGLLHDIGRLVVLRVDPERVRAVHGAVEGGTPLAEAERTAFGARAATLSVWAARMLSLPPQLCGLLFSLDGIDPSPPGEALAVLAADQLAPLFGYPPYRAAVGVPLDASLERRLRLGPADIRRLAEAAAIATRAGRERKADPGQGLSDQCAEHDRAFEALISANRRLALLNADYQRTRQELERRNRDNRRLLHTFASLTLGLDREAIRYSILEALVEHYAPPVAFMVHNDGGGEGALSGVSFGFDPVRGPEAVPVCLDLGDLDREARATLMQGDAFTVTGGASHRALRVAIGPAKAFVLAPLMARGACGGILGLSLGEDQDDAGDLREYLRILATAASLGLENARLYSEVLTQATVDPLTGVATRRVIVDALEDLAREPGAASRPFSVLLLDLDQFKSVNDTLGHQAGDRYLREMAGALRETIGARGRIGRYGGDEFLVLLPGLAGAPARDLAGELVRRAAEVAESPRWRAVPESLGATVGVAAWSGGATEASMLLALADSSLYVGKSAGRSRVGPAACPETADAEKT